MCARAHVQLKPQKLHIQEQLRPRKIPELEADQDCERSIGLLSTDDERRGQQGAKSAKLHRLPGHRDAPSSVQDEREQHGKNKKNTRRIRRTRTQRTSSRSDLTLVCPC